jgi:hypothetical protein
MLINSQIFNQVVSDAKAKSANNPALLRAIDRAVFEILHAAYWSFVAGVLRIQSTTSKKLYVIEATGHTCDAIQNGHKFCKHTISHRLMTRYVERLGASEVTGTTKTVRNWSADGGPVTVEVKRSTVTLTASRLVEAENAPMLKRTVRGEVYNGIDV